tara:strand:- start:200 stop:1000 length:801 start_codon:yes stop_codon:yes gene_type:complete
MTSSQIVPQKTSVNIQLQSLEPSALIELYELTYTSVVNGINTVLRYHAGTNDIKTDIIFNGQTYSAVPAEVKGFDKATQGTLPRPKFRIANVNNAISTFIVLYNPLQGQLQRIQTFKKFLDKENFPDGINNNEDPDAIITKDDIWYIDRISKENPDFVEFELSPKINLQNLRIPRRQITEHCPWKYRTPTDNANGKAGSTECGYKGKKCFDLEDNEITGDNKEALDKCGHKYSSCVKRFGKFGDGGTKKNPKPLPFGGFSNARIQI